MASNGGTPALARGNNASTDMRYDSASRLASIGHAIAGAAVNYTFGSYNPADEIGSRSRDNDAFAWNGAVNVNRSYTSNGLNQYTIAGPANITYDTKGNLAADGSNAYSYDAENRLTSSTGANPGALAYDPLGRLRTTSGGASGTTSYLYDGDALIAEYGPGNTLLRRYVHGGGDDVPLVWYEGTGTADRRWLHADERGSVIAVSNATGGLMAANSYDEYGIPGATNLGRFGYTGQIRLVDQGIYYYKARIYSPTLGRFLQPDPIGYDDGPNWYNYAHSDPINNTDPLGLADGGSDYDPGIRDYGPDIIVIGSSRPSTVYVDWLPDVRVNLNFGGSAGAVSSANPKPAVGANPSPLLQNGNNGCGRHSDLADAALYVFDFAGSTADAATLALAEASLQNGGPLTPQGDGLAIGAAVARGVSATASFASAVVNFSQGNVQGGLANIGGIVAGRVGSRFIGRALGLPAFRGIKKETVDTGAGQIASRSSGC